MPRKSRPAPKKKAKRTTAPASPKLLRWIDLVATLLGHDMPVSLEQLKEEVPGYMGYPDGEKGHESLRRTFERDKDELRSFGIMIATDRDAAGEVRGYRLKRDHFYLPYLSLLQDGKLKHPKTVDRYGYRSLQQLTFEADELEAVREAALRVRRLRIASLDELAASAMRKLAFDLPIDVQVMSSRELRSEYVAFAQDRIPARAAAPVVIDESVIFDTLDDALRRRKRVTLVYRTMGTGTIAERVVLPFGLFFLGHQWYLAAKDAAAGDEGPVKNFRLSRISHATVNAGRPNSADYDIPASFRLSDHAKSREAWELGDTATVDAVVRFTGESGPTVAARRLGTPVAGAPDRRQFEVRRLDTFARWLLSFGGEVEPVSPPELVTAYRDLVDATLAVYAEA